MAQITFGIEGIFAIKTSLFQNPGWLENILFNFLLGTETKILLIIISVLHPGWDQNKSYLNLYTHKSKYNAIFKICIRYDWLMYCWVTRNHEHTYSIISTTLESKGFVSPSIKPILISMSIIIHICEKRKFVLVLLKSEKRTHS